MQSPPTQPTTLNLSTEAMCRLFPFFLARTSIYKQHGFALVRKTFIPTPRHVALCICAVVHLCPTNNTHLITASPILSSLPTHISLYCYCIRIVEKDSLLLGFKYLWRRHCLWLSKNVRHFEDVMRITTIIWTTRITRWHYVACRGRKLEPQSHRKRIWFCVLRRCGHIMGLQMQKWKCKVCKDMKRIC